MAAVDIDLKFDSESLVRSVAKQRLRKGKGTSGGCRGRGGGGRRGRRCCSA